MKSNELQHLIASGLAQSGTACVNNRAHIVDEWGDEAAWWIANINTAADHARRGAGSDKMQITILAVPENEAVRKLTDGGIRGDAATITRVSFAISFHDKQWTGKNIAGLSPTNTELADPANWAPKK